MDLAVAQELLKSSHLKAAFQAFLLTASREGHTVQELADQLGVSKRTLYRWIAKAKSRPHSPRAELVDSPAGYMGDCNHPDAFFFGRRRICIRCLASNMEGDLARDRKFEMAQQRQAKQSKAKFRPKGSKKSA